MGQSIAADKFREVLKAAMMGSGLSAGKATMLLINESQIADESILADVDAIANTGEVI